MRYLLLAAVLVLTLLASPASAGFVRGDANRDGTVTMDDAIAIAKVVGGLEKRGTIQFRAADVNCDRKLTTTDALLIAQYVVLGQPLLWC